MSAPIVLKSVSVRPAGGILVTAVRQVGIWRERRATRRALARLDGHMLRDIGLDGQTVSSEASQRPSGKAETALQQQTAKLADMK